MDPRTAALPCLLAAASLLFAGPHAPSRQEPQSELDLRMERIESALKTLRRELKDPARRDDALRTLLELEAATLEAKAFVPRRSEALSEAERPAFQRDYRALMIELERAERDLESAVLGTDDAAIQAALQAVRAFEERGHERFQADEDEPEPGATPR